MRRQRSDDNQDEIVGYYRGLHCSVLILSPYFSVDLLVGVGSVNDLVEVKDPSKPPSKRQLTPGEIKFAEEWNGKKPALIMTFDDVFAHYQEMKARDRVKSSHVRNH